MFVNKFVFPLAIQDACDQVNKGVINWLFRHRSMKLLSLMTVPFVLPIDIIIVILFKAWQRVPAITKELKNSLFNLITLLSRLPSTVKLRPIAHICLPFEIDSRSDPFDSDLIPSWITTTSDVDPKCFLTIYYCNHPTNTRRLTPPSDTRRLTPPSNLRKLTPPSTTGYLPHITTIPDDFCRLPSD